MTLPAVVALKRPLRGAWWRLKGHGTHNPALPEAVHSVLFVCLGNICRSPFAAAIAARLLADVGRMDIVCSSAGTRPSQAGRSPREACEAAAAYGVDLTTHAPVLLTRALMDAHDIVFVMDARQLQQVRTADPDRADRVFLLPLYDDRSKDGYERYNIADPFGGPRSRFEHCYRSIDRAVRRWTAAVVERPLPSGSRRRPEERR